MGAGPTWRPTAEMTPTVTVFSCAKGLPMPGVGEGGQARLREVAVGNLHQRDVVAGVVANETARIFLAVGRSDLDGGGSGDDVGVGEHQPLLGVDDHAGALGLVRPQVVGVRRGFVRGALAEDGVHVHHGGPNGLDRLHDGVARV